MNIDLMLYKYILIAALLNAGFISSNHCKESAVEQVNYLTYDKQVQMIERAIINNNIKEALFWITKAQTHRNEKHLINLADMLLTHSITIFDQKAAAILYQASQLPSGLAAYKLSYLYKTGIGVKQSSRHSIKWLRKASSLGYAEAQNELDRALKQTSITRSHDRSNQPNNLATKDNKNEYRKDDSHDIHKYAMSLESDSNQNHGIPNIIKLYERAAIQGHPQASYKLGFMYENGTATPIDLKLAKKWYKLAKKNGHKNAKIALLRISKKQSVIYKIKSWWNAE